MRNCMPYLVFIVLLIVGCGDMWVDRPPCLDVEEEETWHDYDSFYEWQNPASDERLPWQEAIEYCNELDWDGHSDWRLPSKGELESILTEDKHYGCYIKEGLCGTCGYYWTSTSMVSNGNYSLVVAFDGGPLGKNPSTDSGVDENLFIRCVRKFPPKNR